MHSEKTLFKKLNLSKKSDVSVKEIPRRWLTSRLVRGDDDVGGDEEGPVLCRRNDVVCFVPHARVQI